MDKLTSKLRKTGTAVLTEGISGVGGIQNENLVMHTQGWKEKKTVMRQYVLFSIYEKMPCHDAFQLAYFSMVKVIMCVADTIFPG